MLRHPTRAPRSMTWVSTACCVALLGLMTMGATAAPNPVDANLPERVKAVQANPKQAEASYRLGARLSSICANCHGQNGVSVTPNTPNLANQNAAYMALQMIKFGDGRRRNEFMQGLMKSMSAEEKVAVIHYFSKQASASSGKTGGTLYNAGKAHYEKVCFRCHGANGLGDENIPRIAGQQATYMTVALKRYRDGSVVRGDPLMEANTRLMTDADINAVAAYVSAMP